MDLLITSDVKFPWCGINKMYCLCLLCTLKCVHPAFHRTQAVKDLDGLLQVECCLHSACSFMGVCALMFFHSLRLTNLFSLQNVEDDGQISCH